MSPNFGAVISFVKSTQAKVGDADGDGLGLGDADGDGLGLGDADGDGLGDPFGGHPSSFG